MSRVGARRRAMGFGPGRAARRGEAAASEKAARPSSRSNGALFFQSVGVSALFVISIVVMFVVLQVTGLWNWFNPLTRRMATWPMMAPHVEMYRLGREDWRVLQSEQARLETWEIELRVEADRLAEEQRALRRAQNELDLERARLAAWEDELHARQALVERLEDEQQALERLREVYEAMRPQEAARILADLSDEEVSRILMDMDPRTAAAILAAFAADRAASVSRLLGP